MADNYLENKYAEYQARKTSCTRTGHTTKTLHKTRRVFITGGAEGIGKAIVRAFRGAGHRVAFCDKNETLGKETALQTGTQFHLVDVSDKTALEDCLRKIIEEWGDIDYQQRRCQSVLSHHGNKRRGFRQDTIHKLTPGVYHLPPISAPSAISRYPQSIRQDYQHLLYPLLDE